MSKSKENWKDGLKTAVGLLLLASFYFITDKLNIRNYIAVISLLLFALYVISKIFRYARFRKENNPGILLPAYNDRSWQVSSGVLGILAWIITLLGCWKFQTINTTAICILLFGMLLIINSLFSWPEQSLKITDNLFHISALKAIIQLQDLHTIEIHADEISLLTISGETKRISHLLLDETIAEKLENYIHERNKVNPGLVIQNELSKISV